MCIYLLLHEHSKPIYLTERCDNFQSGPFEVIFPNGTTRITFPVNITDDDVYEEYESFNLVIDNNLPNRVNLGYPNRAAIVIADDEKRKLLMLVICLFFSLMISC